jgi:hypothetical protein
MRALSHFLLMAIVFSQPIKFAEAAQRRAVQTILPTTLSSAELERISSDILERALFSARVANAEHLQTLADVIDRYLRGELDLASARLEVKQFLASIGYAPQPQDEGGLKDLSSDERISLQIQMNAGMARGYGNWIQGQQAPILDRWPAQELYRAFARRTHRQWSGDDNGEIIKGEPTQGRWVEAGGQIFDGRMIALKNAPIWTAISRFDLPYPPFDFNSGMSIRDIDRETAMELGLIDRDTQIAPETRDFNQDLKYTVDIRDQALRQALEDAGYSFDGDVLTP